MAFQIQAKDSIVSFGVFPTINAVQNLNLDPTFNEENFSELGNDEYSATSRSPETSGSFEVTSTGSIASILARMLYNYTTQAYAFDYSTQGNAYTITHTDFENCVFDLLNMKAPGATFDECLLVPYAQLTGLTLRVDATGTGSETFSFEADLQEALAAPYHDTLTVPCTTTDADTVEIPAAMVSAGINSGTYAMLYVFKDNQKYDSSAASFTSDSEIDVTDAAFTTSAPYNRVSAVLMKRTPGAFPTIYNPTDARFIKGDRIDIWLMNSGVTPADSNRFLRCQSADINVDLTRDRLQEIRRNLDLSTTYWRALNFPLNITVNVNVLESSLVQWASLQGKTIDPGADLDSIDTNNIMNLVDFDESLSLTIRYYLQNNETKLAEVTMTTLGITGFGERQQVQGRAERSLSFVGSNMTIQGWDL